MGALLFIACQPPAPARVAVPAKQAVRSDDQVRTRVDVVRDMEVHPLANDSDRQQARAGLLAQMSEDHAVTVVACTDLLGPGDHTDYVHVDQLLALTIFGEYAYLLEHPGASSTSSDVFNAGLVSAIRGYRNILVVEPSAHWVNFDGLIALGARELEEYVERAMKDCNAAQASSEPG